MPFRGVKGGGETIEVVQNLALVGFVAVVATSDWRSRRIPNAATYPAMLLGLVLGALAGVPGAVGAGGLLDRLAALFIALLLTLPLYATGGLKAGDVKLLMAVGALKGVFFLFWAALAGALLGGVFAAAYVVYQRASGRPLVEIMRAFIPYGVALGLGCLVALAFEVRS